jgi:hypothetical protein
MHAEAMPGGRSEEVFVPFPAPLSLVPQVTRFRSSWVTASIHSLRERGLYERYQSNLGEEDRAALLFAPLGSWMPIGLVLTHYEACDQLALPLGVLVSMGREVTQRIHGGALSLAVKMATGAGVTPWTLFGHMPRLWPRVMEGGGVGVFRLGPKEARVELVGFPLARIGYVRAATAGMLEAMTDAFCTRAWVHEVRALCTSSTLAYRVQWA